MFTTEETARTPEQENSKKWIENLEAAFTSVLEEVPADIAYEEIMEWLDNSEFRMNSPVLLANIIMSNLDHSMQHDRFGLSDKLFWAQVGDAMGADYIGKFRRIGAFMAKVDEA